MSRIKLSEVSEFDKVFRNNDTEALVDDFIMIAGMSEDEANQAATNVLDYDNM